jgi:hypothetical protein
MKSLKLIFGILVAVAIGTTAIAEEKPDSQTKAVPHFVASEDQAEELAFGTDLEQVWADGSTQYLALDNGLATTDKYRVLAEVETVDGRHGYIPIAREIRPGDFHQGFVGNHNLKLKRVRFLWKYRDATLSLYHRSDWVSASSPRHYIYYAIISFHGTTGWYPPKAWSKPI